MMVITPHRKIPYIFLVTSRRNSKLTDILTTDRPIVTQHTCIERISGRPRYAALFV
jgi:hypothetical protein